ncbi:hypothetical protein JTB14_037216 [Gonioctena quinquepunctata]|nr:hypothetical protein JTB14_037216 [Gonioctena quinquepunctata]
MGSITIDIILCISVLKYTSALLGSEHLMPANAPYQAAIFAPYTGPNQKPNCAGALISPFAVLTTTACVRDLPLRLVLGASNISEKEPQTVNHILNGDKISISRITPEIAIIKLPEPVRFNRFIERIRILDTRDETLTHELAHVSSWGDEAGVLKQASAQIRPNNKCLGYHDGFLLENSKICTDPVVCTGDNGAPLVWMNPKTREKLLVGLVSSFAPSCSGETNIYSKLNTSLSWIMAQLQEAREEYNRKYFHSDQSMEYLKAGELQDRSEGAADSAEQYRTEFRNDTRYVSRNVSEHGYETAAQQTPSGMLEAGNFSAEEVKAGNFSNEHPRGNNITESIETQLRHFNYDSEYIAPNNDEGNNSSNISATSITGRVIINETETENIPEDYRNVNGYSVSENSDSSPELLQEPQESGNSFRTNDEDGNTLPRTMPNERPRESTMRILANSPMRGLLNSPLRGLVKSPMRGLLNSPMRVLANSPMRGLLNSPLRGLVKSQ